VLDTEIEKEITRVDLHCKEDEARATSARVHSLGSPRHSLSMNAKRSKDPGDGASYGTPQERWRSSPGVSKYLNMIPDTNEAPAFCGTLYRNQRVSRSPLSLCGRSLVTLCRPRGTGAFTCSSYTPPPSVHEYSSRYTLEALPLFAPA
jgi:hypothetical protein